MEMDVEECPVSNKSMFTLGVAGKTAHAVIRTQGFKLFLSARQQFMSSKSVSDIKTSLSVGLENALCNAIVSSTSPRFDAKCPPWRDTVSIMVCRISPANSSSCCGAQAFHIFRSLYMRQYSHRPHLPSVSSSVCFLLVRFGFFVFKKCHCFSDIKHNAIAFLYGKRFSDGLSTNHKG